MRVLLFITTILFTPISWATNGCSSQLLDERYQFPEKFGTPKAALPDGKAIEPQYFRDGYHGSDKFTPEQIIEWGGIPAKSKNPKWKLLEHVRQDPDSAFRGMTEDLGGLESAPGAAFWAGDKGWVYKIGSAPAWDANANLAGKIKTGAKFIDNPYRGEREIVIPAQMPIFCIEQWGMVKELMSGNMVVRNWTTNPHYDLKKCLKYWGR